MARVFDAISGWASGMLAAATGKNQTVQIPKGKAGQKSFPGNLTSTTPAESPLQKTDRRTANKDLNTYRNGTTTKQVIRDLSVVNPDLSGAVNAYLRVGIPDDYSAYAQNPDGSFNVEATSFLQQMLSKINTGQNYLDGFSGWWSIRSLSEALGKELLLEGAAALELVLDKGLVPAYFAPVAVSTVSFIPDKSSQFKLLRPIQKIGSVTIDLDVPTFFYVALDPELIDASPNSPLESAVQPALFSQDFMNDVRRVVRQAIHPRVNVTLDTEALRSMAPVEAQSDPVAMREFETALVTSIRDTLNDLEPEDALVHLDFMKVEPLDRGNTSLDREYDTLSGLSDSKMSTGAKVPSSVLGQSDGTQNAASTESLVFMKSADGTIRMKLNEIYSRALTLACKLVGYDVTATFEFARIDLRPDSELEAFKSQKQSRILEQLSLGLITDEEACIRITGNLPPAGMPKLSGTMFKAAAAQTGNAYSGSPHGGGQSGGGPLNQNLKPDTKPQPGGKPTKAEVIEMPRG